VIFFSLETAGKGQKAVGGLHPLVYLVNVSPSGFSARTQPLVVIMLGPLGVCLCRSGRAWESDGQSLQLRAFWHRRKFISGARADSESERATFISWGIYLTVKRLTAPLSSCNYSSPEWCRPEPQHSVSLKHRQHFSSSSWETQLVVWVAKRTRRSSINLSHSAVHFTLFTRSVGWCRSLIAIMKQWAKV
jgi:hypothetical protein